MGGRVALVTGGTRGIGRATAVGLARDGHRVAIAYARDQEGAESTCTDIDELGAEAFAVRADVGDGAAVDAAFTAIEQAWGPVDVLVNNAGMTRDGLVARMSDEHWGRVLATNLG